MVAFDLTDRQGCAAFDAHRWAYEDRWTVPVVGRAVACRLPAHVALEVTALEEWHVTMEDLGYASSTPPVRTWYLAHVGHRSDQRAGLALSIADF